VLEQSGLNIDYKLNRAEVNDEDCMKTELEFWVTTEELVRE